jgi:hypothetical protein
MSLVKSILISKIALLILFIRTLFFNNVRRKVFYVDAPTKEYHEHYYHSFEHPEDNKPGWLGKPPSSLV